MLWKEKNYVMHIHLQEGDDLTFQYWTLVGYDFIHSCGVLVVLRFNLNGIDIMIIFKLFWIVFTIMAINWLCVLTLNST